jgi:hypothetical protein
MFVKGVPDVHEGVPDIHEGRAHAHEREVPTFTKGGSDVYQGKDPSS